MRVAISRSDGGVSIMNLPDYTDDDMINAEVNRYGATLVVNDGLLRPMSVVGWKRVDAIPERDEYRNAWALKGDAVDHDMAKAREIHKDILRAQRKPMLEALDVEYQRADEVGDVDAKRAIAAKKQALRDVTKDPSIGGAATLDELKAVIPAALRVKDMVTP